MSFANTSTICYSLRCNDDTDQILQVRLSSISRLISRSTSVGLPYEILQESSSSPMADVLFPLPLRKLEDPSLFEAYVVQLLSSFNLGAIITCEFIARKITSFVVQLAAGNYDVKFRLVAKIDYIQMFWPIDQERSSVRMENNVMRGVMVEERVVLEEAPLTTARRCAAERTTEKLKKHKLEEFGQEEELGYCSICYEELKRGVGMGTGKEIARIPCRHVYHKSCILTWFQRSNSCPLCRKKLDEKN